MIHESSSPDSGLPARTFVLATERSGSTWLANIFDAHPQTLLLMEPFTPSLQLFPAVPPRHVYVSKPSPQVIDAVWSSWTSLESAKHSLLSRPGCPRALDAVDEKVLFLMSRAARRVGLRPNLRLSRQHHLNLHQLHVPTDRRTRKRKGHLIEVIKELRLNFKVPLLQRTFPGSRYVVIVRHPGAQLGSIVRMMSRGRLVELRASLPALTTLVNDSDRFAEYREAAAHADSFERLLAFWWIVNNDVLLHDLDRLRCPYEVLRHETLSESPLEEAERALAHVGLASTAEVRDFVQWSSSTCGDPSTPVDTRRNSRSYSKSSIAQAPDHILHAITEISRRVNQAALHPVTRSYLAPLAHGKRPLSTNTGGELGTSSGKPNGEPLP